MSASAPSPQPAAPVLGISHQDASSAFVNAPIGMAVVTPVGVITSCNSALTAMLGSTADRLLGGTFFDVTHPEDIADAYQKCLWMQAGGIRLLRHECRFLRSDGDVLWVMVSTSRVPDVPGHPAHLIMHVEDISDRKALEAELNRRALHDPLTGLANRALLLDRITHALAHSSRSLTPTCLLFLDLNGFKAVNDTYGHSVGDRVLQQLGDRVTDLLRPQDTAARLGGDEFVVLCQDTSLEQAEGIAGRLRAAAAQPFGLDPHTVTLSAAIGIAIDSAADRSGQAAPDPEALLHQADVRMYRAKTRKHDGDVRRGSRPDQPAA